MKRIAIPYELFLFGLAIIYVVLGKKLPLGNWLSCVFFVQGANVGVLGADHTWFITAIMLCYIVTPLLSKIWTKLDGKRGTAILPLMFFVIPLSMPFFMNSYAYTIVHQVFFFAVSYIIGYEYGKQRVVLKKIYLVPLFFIMCFSFGIRLVAKVFIDGTWLYNLIIVSYTQYISAVCIFGIFLILLKNIHTWKVVKWFDGISFEIYLWHYMFMVGPISVMNLTNSWILNSLLAVGLALTVAEICNKVATMLHPYLKSQPSEENN